jgi:hypothetical protein
MLREEGIELHFMKKVDAKTGEWRVPFQGADRLAGECRRGDLALHGIGAVRDEFHHIMKRNRMEGKWKHVDAGVLVRLCERNPAKYPCRTEGIT